MVAGAKFGNKNVKYGGRASMQIGTGPGRTAKSGEEKGEGPPRFLLMRE